MAKLLGGFAVVLLCSASAATAQPAGQTPARSRQEAMWQHLFQPVDDGSDSSAPAAPWSLQARAEPDGELVLASLPLQPGTDTRPPAAQAPAGAVRPKAFQYSDAYGVRRKIHMVASFATIPLFVTQYALGDKLFDGTDSTTKSAHSAMAVGIEALFAVNTVTGVWNLWESRKDPNGRKKRFIHSFLMLGADAGFVVTGLTAPDTEEGRGSKSTHRTVAITSMAVSAASYLMMLIGR
jgi:hypothetical protein